MSAYMNTGIFEKYSTLRIFLVTYNVAGQNPPDDLTRLLKLDSKELPNLYAICLQELKDNVIALLTDAILDDPWTNALTDCLFVRGYIRIKNVRLLGMHLTVFVQRKDLASVVNVESTTIATGYNGLWGNKGGICLRMNISGVNVCFVNSHLPAHIPNVVERVKDYSQILAYQGFNDEETDGILDHDYIFWMGDLNFRLDDISKADVEQRIKDGDLASLWPCDQLKKLMKKEMIFVDFEEGSINFSPTYKFDKGTDLYDTSKKKRIPAWCDRILWMVNENAFCGCNMDVQQLSYHSLPEYRESDHKPVVGEFIIKVLSYPPVLPVMFEPMETWLQSKDQKVCYSIAPEYQAHKRDWIGLYKHNHRHAHDYKAYAWGSMEGDNMGDGSLLYEVEFDHGYFWDFDGMFCLCYFSYKKNCIVGYSDSFLISPTEESSSDSSDSADVIIRTKVRNKTGSLLRKKKNMNEK